MPPTNGDLVYQNAGSSVGLALSFPSCFLLIAPIPRDNPAGDLEDTHEVEILNQRKGRIVRDCHFLKKRIYLSEFFISQGVIIIVKNFILNMRK